MSELTDRVRRSTDLVEEEAAERAVEGTVETLAEVVSPGEAEDVASELPAPLAATMRDVDPEREPPSLETFLDRVHVRGDVPREEAEAVAQAVLAALVDVVGADELADAQAQLPPEYDVLFETAEELPERSVPRAVARESELELSDATRATRATLTTLGERLSGGELEDLAEFLPDPSAGWVCQDGPAEEFDVDEFAERVAERAGVGTDEAVEHARAVARVLEGATSEREWQSARTQLPDEYDRVFAPA